MSNIFPLIRNEIILIGPMAVGKSTVSIQLAEKLGISYFPIDEIKWYFLYRNGYNISTAKKILLTKGFEGKMNYFYKYFGVEEVRQILDEFKGGVLDFGATHTYHVNKMSFNKIKYLLSQFHNVFLLLPTDNLKNNIKILNRRITDRYIESYKNSQIIQSYLNYNNLLLSSKKFNLLTSNIIYTESKSIEQIVSEILENVK